MNLDGKTNAELVAMDAALCQDPQNANTGDGGLNLYNRKTQRKLEEIRRQIAWNMKQGMKARGEYINEDGYSGRKCNRRR